jgi:hypothetical protein
VVVVIVMVVVEMVVMVMVMMVAVVEMVVITMVEMVAVVDGDNYVYIYIYIYHIPTVAHQDLPGGSEGRTREDGRIAPECRNEISIREKMSERWCQKNMMPKIRCQ